VNDLIKAGARANDQGRSLLSRPDPQALARFNRKVAMAERDFIEPAGLPDRPWYRHVIYAPGFYTGYSVKTLPGIREAIEAKNLQRAKEQTGVVVRAVRRAVRTLGQ
jgi:N-acetylated-alpha-linked acidic dipeptidase